MNTTPPARDWLSGIAERIMDEPSDPLALHEHELLLRREDEAYARCEPARDVLANRQRRASASAHAREDRTLAAADAPDASNLTREVATQIRDHRAANGAEHALGCTHRHPVDLPAAADLTAAQLRALYAGNPIIDRLEADLRTAAVSDRDTAAAMLRMHVRYRELTNRERAGVLARFDPPEGTP